MKFNLSNPIEVQKAKVRFEYLILNQANIDLVKISPKRTIQQNKFLHVIITLFGIHVGYTIEEAKTHLKRACGFCTYEVKGEKFLKQTRDMDPAEMTSFIDWIRNYSANQCGYYLCSPDEYIQNQSYFDNEIESVKEYL